MRGSLFDAIPFNYVIIEKNNVSVGRMFFDESRFTVASDSGHYGERGDHIIHNSVFAYLICLIQVCWCG